MDADQSMCFRFVVTKHRAVYSSPEQLTNSRVTIGLLTFIFWRHVSGFVALIIITSYKNVKHSRNIEICLDLFAKD